MVREFVEIVFEIYYGLKYFLFLVDIFVVLKYFNIMYKFFLLDNSEGMYILDKDGLVFVVGIYYYRLYEC